jgi:predicted DCC family thiol-disulfide oxidoreductase YuxK
MENKSTILIDNKCAFCSRIMQFMLLHGGMNKFIFLSIYSDESKKLLTENNLPSDYDKSVVLLENNNVFIKSSAILKIAKKLNGLYPLLYWFKIIPVTIRDYIYDLISKHRNSI